MSSIIPAGMSGTRCTGAASTQRQGKRRRILVWRWRCFEGKRKSLQGDCAGIERGRSGTKEQYSAPETAFGLRHNLIQVDPEMHLWAESYEREERDVLDLQPK